MRQFLCSSRMAALLVALHALGCGRGTETDNPLETPSDKPVGVQEVRSTKAYLTEVSTDPSDSDALRSGARSFALDLYRQVVTRTGADENLCLGTHSVDTVLAMTSAGARGATEAELFAVLRHGLTQTALHPAMNQLAQDLRAGITGTTVKYEPIQSIWMAKDHRVADAFLDVLAEQYDAGVFLADFANNAEGARASINDWVAKQTQQLIPELFAAGTIDPLTRLVLTNAAYLSAPWQDRLDPEQTKEREFSLTDGSVVDVSMMGREWRYPYAFDIDWRALELPFTAPHMSMIFVLPNAGKFSDFESHFDATMVERIATSLDASRAASRMVSVNVPRFDFASNIDLKPSLEGLGMLTAFDPNAADFSGIEPGQNLYVSRFVHRTTIAIDENGTTAAVATGNVMEPMAISPQINLNRPFFFFIYDRSTGTVLFVGRLVRPAGTAHAPAQPTVTKTDAEQICASLAKCQGRTTSEADCQAALAADTSDVVGRCADCIRLGTDECGGMPSSVCTWGHGDICAPATCADYCPGHAF